MVVEQELASKDLHITSVTGFGRYNFSLNLQPGREMDNIMLSSKLHAISKINELRRSHGGLFMNNYSLISIKCHPSPATFNRAKSLKFAVLNTRSIRNKSLIVKDFIVDRDVDILALTETWLNSSDLDSQIIRDICPTGYELHSVPRGRLGGGIALVHKKPLRFQKQSCIIELNSSHLSS